MGIDVEIWVKTKPDASLPDLVHLGDNWENLDIDIFRNLSGYRLYDIGYERGFWPQIAADLMLLLECPDVEKVWYGGDCTTGCLEELTIDRFLP